MPKTQKPNTDEIASFEKDIFRDFLVIGQTVLNPDRVLKSEAGGRGVDLYDDLLRDDQVIADLNTRRNAVIGREWDVIPASEKRTDVNIAEFVKQVLVSCNHDTARKALLSGLVLGFKPVEIMWDYSEGDVFIKEFLPRASRRFTFGTDRGLRMLTFGNMVEGEQVPGKKFQLFVNPSDNGSPYGDGLGRALYWLVWFKKNGTKFAMIFADKFGSPTVIGKYPPGTQKEQQDALLDACEAIQQESSIKIPNTMVIELLEAARTSSQNIYEFMLNYFNGQISKVILSHSAASESTPGKLGNEDRAQNAQDRNLKSDADLLCEQENAQIVKWIVDYNFPGVKQYPKLWVRTEEEKDMKPQAERDQVLVDLGLPIAERYFYEQYGQDMKPENGEPIVVPRPQASPFGSPDPGAGLSTPFSSDKNKGAFSECRCGHKHSSRPSRLRGENGFDFAEQDAAWVADYLNRLQPVLQNAKAGALDQIKAWLQSQQTPPTPDAFIAKVKEILGSAYSNIDRNAVSDAVAGIYGDYKRNTPGMQATATFGGADLRAVSWLSDVDRMFYSKFISNPDAQDAVTNFLTERYLKGGEGLFGRGNPATIEEFVNMLGQKMTEISGFQAQRIADTSVQRIRNFAHIQQMNDIGAPRIKIIEPTEECAFCASMDGREIEVDTAFGLMQQLMGMTPDEYIGHLQNNPATLDNIDQLLKSGALPPYHPFCHGFFVVAT